MTRKRDLPPELDFRRFLDDPVAAAADNDDVDDDVEPPQLPASFPPPPPEVDPSKPSPSFLFLLARGQPDALQHVM